MKIKELKETALIPLAINYNINIYMGNKMLNTNNELIISTTNWDNIPDSIMDMEATLICPDGLTAEGYKTLSLRVKKVEYTFVFSNKDETLQPMPSPSESIRYSVKGFEKAFICAEGIVYAIEVLSFCLYDGDTSSLGYEYALLPYETFSYEYGGKHFVPHSKLEDGATIFNVNLRTDFELGFFDYDSPHARHRMKFQYNHENFYKAMHNCEMDIFECVENGKLYIPGNDTLFIYEGRKEEKK